MLEFILENLGEIKECSSPSSTNLSISFREQNPPEIIISPVSPGSSITNDDIKKMYNDSDILSKNISAQKQRILRIYESFTETVSKSKYSLDSKNPFSYSSSADPLERSFSDEPIIAKKSF